jgi:hypothetical protein
MVVETQSEKQVTKKRKIMPLQQIRSPTMCIFGGLGVIFCKGLPTYSFIENPQLRCMVLQKCGHMQFPFHH